MALGIALFWDLNDKICSFVFSFFFYLLPLTAPFSDRLPPYVVKALKHTLIHVLII